MSDLLAWPVTVLLSVVLGYALRGQLDRERRHTQQPGPRPPVVGRPPAARCTPGGVQCTVRRLPPPVYDQDAGRPGGAA